MYAEMLMTEALFLLVLHQSRRLAENGARVYGSNRQPLRLGAIRPSSAYSSDFREQSGLTGAAAHPGPRKTSWLRSGSGSPAGIWKGKKETKKKTQNKPDQFQTLPVRCRATVAMETYSFFSFSRAEKGPFMSSMVQEISFFWRSL